MYEQYAGVGLLNMLYRRYPNNSNMRRICRETVTLIIDRHKGLVALCNRLSSRHWSSKEILLAVKSTVKWNNENFKNEMACYFPSSSVKKIEWKKKGKNGKKTSRSATSIGNLRWRESGFKRQAIITKVSDIPNRP